MHRLRRLMVSVMTRVLVLSLGMLGAAGVARGADVPVTGLKLIVVDKITAASKAKAVFVAKDTAVTKGTGTDPAQISATLDVAYDAVGGTFEMPTGSAWLVNKDTVAKYVNKTAPTGGATKVSVIKPALLVKVVGKSLGDTPLDISSAPAGNVYVVDTIVNGGDETRLCTQFTGCTHKSIAGDTGYKLICKGNSTGDPACTAAAPTSTTTTTSTTSTTQCPAGQTPCGPDCVNTDSDPNNCGGCGNDCNTACTGNVAATVCSTGMCTISSCTANQYDADGLCGNGCECTGQGSGGSSCGAPTSLGTLSPGGSISVTGNVPDGGARWFQVTYASGGTPKIQLTSGSPSYVFDVWSSCTSAVCLNSPATGICVVGVGTFQIAVKAVSGPVCSTYTLQLQN